jgi:hypothetical protein
MKKEKVKDIEIKPFVRDLDIPSNKKLPKISEGDKNLKRRAEWFNKRRQTST